MGEEEHFRLEGETAEEAPVEEEVDFAAITGRAPPGSGAEVARPVPAEGGEAPKRRRPRRPAEPHPLRLFIGRPFPGPWPWASATTC